MENKLHLDYAVRISEFQAAMKQFELKTKLYRTLFRGRGLEFEGYRTYESDDDASFIDWKATARANKPLVKEYSEEKNFEFLFLIDISEGMLFGSGNKLKCECAAEVALSLSHLIMKSGNKFGFLFYNSKVQDFILPSKGDSHFSLFLDKLENASMYGGDSNLSGALDYILDLKMRDFKAVIIISDFINFDMALKDKLEVLTNKLEVFSFMIRDPLDMTLPDYSGEVVIEDPKSNEQLLINPRFAKIQFERNANQQKEAVKKILKESNVDLLSLNSDKNFVPELAEFLKERVRVGRIV